MTFARLHAFWIPQTICVLLATLALAGAPPAAQPKPATQPSSADAGADLVALFYKVLLQDDAPTIEQERELFTVRSALRVSLVGPDGLGDRDDEPMRRTQAQLERREHALMAVDAAGPVVLEYFRSHREWFTPAKRSSGTAIHISSTWAYVRNVDNLKDPVPAGNGYVIATFIHDQRHRSIVFTIENGRIDPSYIRLDGLDGSRSTLGERLDEVRR